MASPSQLALHAKKIAALQAAKKAAQAAKAADKGSDLIHISELADYYKQKDAASGYAKPADDLLSGATAEDLDSWLSSDTDEPLKKTAVAQGYESEWTPAFSQKVWDHWFKIDPHFWSKKQSEAQKALAGMGLIDNAAAPSAGKEIEQLAAQHLPPDFFHTEKGLPSPDVSLQSELLAAGGGGGGWDLPDGALWSSSGPKPTPQFRPPQEYYERPPEMGIREYVAKLRELAQSPEHRKGVARAVNAMEEGFADAIKKGHITGFLPEDSGPAAALHNARNRDYLDYLSAHGVDQRTLDAIASGDLRMDAASRADRAAAMDLDPNAVWYRWDSPLKKEMKGFTGAALSQANKRRLDKGGMKFVNLQPKSEGLVYTSHNPDYARLGVQVPRDEITLYPLLGPNSGIAGIDRMPPEAYDAFKQRQAASLKAKYPESPERQRIWLRTSHLAENLNPAGDLEDWHDWREHALKRLERVSPESETTSLGGGTYPSFDVAEHRKGYTEPLMAAGAKGTLVSDEAGLSTAFTPAGARVLRRADLAPLDVRFRSARNILQSLMLPTAIAGGAAAAQQPGVLSGLTEQR
jgi:hypothetical protein